MLTACASWLLTEIRGRAAQQVINVGPFPDSGLGEGEYYAFQKVNSNFTELYASFGPGLGFSNVGLAGGQGIYRAKIGGTNVQLNMIQQGSNIVIYSNINGIFINAASPINSTNGNANTIESFGGVGDGATDNYGAMTNAIITTSVAGGGTIIFGPKTYRISQTLPFTDLRSITFSGAGVESTILELNLSGGTIAGFNFSSTTLKDGITFENMTVRGVNDSDTSPWDLILIGEAWGNFIFRNCKFQNARHAAIRESAAVHGTNYIFDNCVFETINSPNMAEQAGGSVLGSFNLARMRNCVFRNPGTNRTTFHAVYWSALTNWSIIDTYFEGTNARPHIYSSGQSGRIIGCTMRDVANITVYSDTTLMSDCTLTNSSVKWASPNSLFSGNFISRGQVQILDAVNQNFIGNTISNQSPSSFFIVDSINPVD